MKWLNKMKKWFQAEEIIEIEEIIVDEPIDKETLKTMDFSQLPKSKKEEIEAYNQKVAKMSQSKDPEAKILFQYPKGQFKFPLIPDEDPQRRKTRNVREKRDQREQRSQSEPRRPDFQTETAKKRHNVKEAETTRRNHREPSKKIVPSTTPFRPTEIPSPIYGFRRPEKKTVEAVEFELESKYTPPVLKREAPKKAYFSHNTKEEVYDEIKLSPPILVPEQPVEKKEEVVREIPAYFRKNLEDTKEEEILTRKESAHVDHAPLSFGEEIAVSSVELDARPAPAYQAMPEQAHMEAEEAIKVTPETVRSDSGANEIAEARAEEPETVKEEPPFHTTVPAQTEEFLAVQENNQADFTEEVVSLHAEQLPESSEETFPEMQNDIAVSSQEPADVEEAPVSEVPEVTLAEVKDEAEPVMEKAEEPVAEVKRPKKHIPFNVMMLKQDHSRTSLPVRQPSEKKNLPSERGGEVETASAVDAAARPAVQEEQVEHVVSKTNTEEPQAPSATVDEGHTAVITEPETANPIRETTEAKEFPNEASAEPKVQPEHQETHLAETPAAEVEVEEEEENPYYMFPDVNLLTPPAYAEHDDEWLEEQTVLLDETLKNFNVRAKVVNVTQGPAVTRFEVHPEPGVKVNKVTNLMDDIKLSLAARDMRMEAPIPGKHTIGIEIPNRKSKPVFLREVLESPEFLEHDSPLAVALGLDISGQPIITDLRKMPHGLIAGQTGSGKSVCINTMLVSLLYKATPQELKLLLIDPKMVELAPYNQIPHLVSPVITDVKAATASLKWAVEEMERRYELFVHAGVRDISRYNETAEKAGQHSQKLPYILIIIDELADLMMMSPADVEEAICRIAQKARACGIHLIVATQRPSVDVITGLIKANIPTRIAFSVSSQIDSRTIIDSGGAEKLLGRGDMLFAENGSSKTVRLQGTFVSDEEIDQVVNHVKLEQKPRYLFEQEDLMERAQVTEETDELFFEACEFVVHQQAASASSVQRRFRVGYNRASRLIEMMEQQGIVSESRGSRPRDVLITEEELEYLHMN